MVLVVGATGVLGSLIVRKLLEEQHPVRALVRRGSAHRALEQAGAEIVFGDLKQPDTIVRACRGMAAVVTTANSASRNPPDTIQTVDQDGNATLIEAAESVANVLTTPPPRVQFIAFGAYSLDFRLLVWSNQPRRHVQVRSDINYRIFQLFQERNIRIPYPTQEFLLNQNVFPANVEPSLVGADDGPRMQD